MRFTERCVVPSGDGGFVAEVTRALRGAGAGGVLKLCMDMPAGAATSGSTSMELVRVRDARSGVGGALFGAREGSLDA